MRPFKPLKLSMIFIVISILLMVIGITSTNLFESTLDASLDDLIAVKPIAVSKKMFLAGTCTIQVYGWISNNPAPIDGADERLEIQKIEANLISQDTSESLVVRAKTEADPTVWEVVVPHFGELNLIIQSYKPPTQLKYGTVFLSCENSISKLLGILMISSIFTGIIGLLLIIIFLFKITFNKFIT